MNKKKLIGYVMTGVLSVGIVGGLGASAFATSTQENDKVKQSTNSLTDTETQERIQKIKDELKALGITLPGQVDKDEYLANLDAATKKKLEAIAGKIKTNKLTSEEALEIRKQRINLPKQEKRAEKFANIDAETRAKAKEVLEKVMAGTMTKDEAKAELEKLGVPLPNLGEIRKPLAHLDSDTKAKAEAINKKLKEGTMTKEEAAIEIRKLRINLPGQGEKDQNLIDKANTEKENHDVKPPRF
ncbi:hypothetical protein [Cytobacillus dafuensis]|uniref:Uncharacterized protein n=1 Tax=Cytobacillus dafuensis TaxID=1742359 RepID=A0A5B8Z639_CYTDA|nr:hypothetical protein [Cytobacillus dafuensis]QED46856.1 hypothetical protein FSZ17_05965 [Cytobacillus dafuensis]